MHRQGQKPSQPMATPFHGKPTGVRLYRYPFRHIPCTTNVQFLGSVGLLVTSA
jgi:hypothetical protein